MIGRNELYLALGDVFGYHRLDPATNTWGERTGINGLDLASSSGSKT